MKKIILFGIMSLFFSQVHLAAPKIKNGKQSESKKMKAEIDRIEKRVNEINKNIEQYKENEKKLDELEIKYEETITDLRLK